MKTYPEHTTHPKLLHRPKTIERFIRHSLHKRIQRPVQQRPRNARNIRMHLYKEHQDLEHVWSDRCIIVYAMKIDLVH